MKLKELLSQFVLFDPAKGQRADLPDMEGNYVVVFKAGCDIPGVLGDFEYPEISLGGVEYRLLYTGISSNLKTRLWSNHLHGNGGNSTLRKTLGSLFRYKKIPRDAGKPNNGKTKFEQANEQKLTEWMENSLLFAYFVNDNNSDDLEKDLIDTLQPPLNVDGNSASTVHELHTLRTKK